MGAAAVAPTGTRAARLVRVAALRALLAAAIVAGLLSMHGPSPLVTPAATSPGGSVASAMSHHAQQNLDATVSSGAILGDLDDLCGACGAAGHVTVAMACALGLLLALVVLVVPRAPTRCVPLAARVARRMGPTSHVLPRPPSLHVLCISRT